MMGALVTVMHVAVGLRLLPLGTLGGLIWSFQGRGDPP